MKTNNNIPAYRFQSYTDAWELRKLGEVIEQQIREVDKPDDAYRRLSVRSHAKGTFHQLVEDPSTVAMDKLYIVKADDLIVNITFAWEHAIAVANLYDDGLLVSHRFPTYRAKCNSDIKYLKYLVSQEDFRRKLEFISPGGAGRNRVMNKKDFINLKAVFPTLPEQTTIGTFFSTLDQHITLHQRKLDTLKEQKKTYLKLLFPAKGQTKPALRFRGFEDDWEEVKLGEVLIKNSKRNKDLRIINVESVSNRLGFVKQTEQFEDYSVASSDLSNYYVISEKQFAYNPSRINVGSIAYKKLGEESSVVSPLYVSFSTSENVEDYYLWYWFKTELFHSQRIVFSEGGVRDTLSYNQLSEIILSLPSLPEQEAIGTFFQTLDQEIAQVEDKLASLKEMKKTLLRKLFV
ncbi:restriction endonuclease subunit S [Streptococcus porcorum]|uniref:Type I restriction enzyme S subunit n=1 Tax=Streptococcus porcorum TaxID=701526 RepID=A0ABV2JCY6_9STRE